MFGFRPCSVLLVAAILLACLPGCSRKQVYHDEKFSVYGVDPNPMRRFDYIGAISDLPAAAGADVTVRTFRNTVYCKGTLSPAEAGKTDGPATGTGALTCGDGRSLNVRWTALSAATGIAEGEFSDGRGIVFTYGFDSPAQSNAAIKSHRATDAAEEAGEKPESGEARAEPGKAGKDAAGAGSEKQQQQEPRWNSNGTGFFISDNGLLVTNEHVVRGAPRLGVENTVTGQKYEATLLVEDKENDLAILKITARTKGLPLGSNKNVRKGQDVMALGYPVMQVQGSEQKATFGRINALSGAGGDIRFFQTDAPLQPGNSGGPLLSMNGEVVGVNTQRLEASATEKIFGAAINSVYYAVKVDYVKALLTNLPQKHTLTGRKADRAASMAELVTRCEESVVIVWAEKSRQTGKRYRAIRTRRY